jgi:large subunit ribosomal protein L4
MELTVYNLEKSSVGKVAVPKALEGKANKALLHQVVVAQQTNRRQGNSKVKNRHEVVGSTRKIYRQKGTGGARHGDIKAPLFVGGGRAFGPKPKEYEVVLPQKIRQAALREAVTLRCGEGKLWVIDAFDSKDFKEPKTKKASQIFKKFEITGALVVLDGANVNAEKSIRNLAGFKVARVEAMNVLDVLRYKNLVLSRKAYDRLVARWNGKAGEVAA